MTMSEFIWRGSAVPHLDDPVAGTVGPVTFGLYGGNAKAGATKNEDGAMSWASPDWVFAVLLDAHHSAESADAFLDLVTESKTRLVELFEAGEFTQIREALVDLVAGTAGIERLRGVRGETAVLTCFQRGSYLLWLSVGDNQLYLLHPELERLGQYTLTARNYFEWIGERSSLALEVPCYSTGIRELRQGENIIALVTDGLLEFGERPFEDPRAFAEALRAGPDLDAALAKMFAAAHAGGATDSATVLAWRARNPRAALMPSG